MTTPASLRASVNHRARKKVWAIAFLGGKCKRCGGTENLEFDHIDRATKLFTIGSNMGRRKDVLISELKKCRLLCHKCHMEVTVFQRGQMRAKHGSCGMYSNWGCRCKPCKAAWAAYWRTKKWR